MNRSLLRWLFLLAAGVTLAGRHGDAAPVAGSAWDRHELSAGGVHRQDVVFRGGQRACVIVEGKHNPPAELSLKVFDDQGGLVGEDKEGGDYGVVIWYPVRDASFRVEVKNLSTEKNPVRVVVK